MKIKLIMVGMLLHMILLGCSFLEVNNEMEIDNENVNVSSSSENLTSETMDVESNEKYNKVSNVEELKNSPKLEISSTINDIHNEKVINGYFNHFMTDEYSDVNGILTFRGNNLRNKTSVGHLQYDPQKIEHDWVINTSFSPEWSGGSGWTGQPLVVNWGLKIVRELGIYDEFKYLENFYEVIQASLDGNVYFIDLETGEQTRDPIELGNPIKGTPALDSRGYPLLVVGEGIPNGDKIDLVFINLITNEIEFRIPGIDDFAYRRWGAFDGSPLISGKTDTLVTNGENGLIYKVKLNSDYNIYDGTYSFKPEVNKMRYKREGEVPGIESSIVSLDKYVFTADNSGMIQAIDTDTMETLWASESYDDTDSTMLLNQEGDNYYLYTASEIDLQGSFGKARIRKFDASNGELIWMKDIDGFSIVGDNPVNGGFLASPLLGEGKSEGQIIFNMARYETINSGLLISLDLSTGEEVWSKKLEHYAWSSPAGTTDFNDNFYIVQADSVGNIFLLNSKGEEIDRINVGYNIEATPVIIRDKIIVGSRGGHIHSFKIK